MVRLWWAEGGESDGVLVVRVVRNAGRGRAGRRVAEEERRDREEQEG